MTRMINIICNIIESQHHNTNQIQRTNQSNLCEDTVDHNIACNSNNSQEMKEEIIEQK